MTGGSGSVRDPGRDRGGPVVTVITGTDTEVGKTVVTAALAARHLARGDRTAVVKCAQTGVADGEPGDLDEVVRLAGAVDVMEGVRLPAPLAPDRAATIAGRSLPTGSDYRDLIVGAAVDHDCVLVEGSGGVLVRLGVEATLLDVAVAVQASGFPVRLVVVCRAGLGTLNHTALTVEAIQRRGLVVQGLVIGSWPVDAGLAEQHNREDLWRYTGVPVIGSIPAGAGGASPDDFRVASVNYLTIGDSR